MNNETAAHVATLAALLARLPFVKHSAAYCAADAVKLNTLATAATSNATNLCNLPNYQDTFDKRQASIAKSAAGILDHYGLEARTTGDPRGSCFRIRMVNGPQEFNQVPDEYRAFYASRDGEDGFRL